jgi:hypothetical protein
MIKQIFTPLSVLVVLFLSSCSKQDVTATADDLIGTWEVTGIRSDRPYDWDGDGYSETDIYNTYSFCQREIILEFENNGYGQARQGCNSFWENMYWDLSGRNLRIDLAGDDLNLDLVQFTPYTIRGDDYVYVNGQNFVITYTLSKR